MTASASREPAFSVPNALPHRKDQADAAARLGERAAATGRRVLSSDTLAAAYTSVTKALNVKGDGPINAAATDVRALRADDGFNSKLNTDLADNQGQITSQMLAAMEQGYTSELDFQVGQIKGLHYNVTSRDRADMADYPIQGHTCAEISRYMHDGLRYELTGLLYSPLNGDSSVKTLASLLGAATNRFGDRCSGAVQEAFYAGVQMALRGVADAMGA
jgi:hypothetical protein